ncbi:MAG: UDP-N-acetylmuramate dehydrogenase [Candidatus Gracilibacteria bacterium]|nr:UDP-N-acetylmuramate dehydrogenase [Candidatus Gracilibacteria bacterium]
MAQVSDQFLKSFPKGKLNESISRYTTFRLGGFASYFYNLEDESHLPSLISFAKEHELPYFILSGGSNLLFPDEGFNGLVIRMDNQYMEIFGTDILASSGTLISKLVNFSVDNNLQGLEKWASLPGTVGGAVRGNAGCHGLETKDILKEAKVLNPDTLEIETIPLEQMDFSYRHSVLKTNKKIVLSAVFALSPLSISKEEQKSQLDEAINFRLQKQPFGFSAGSFFKNPSPERPAGMLIEQSGLKGHQIGGAKVSEKHANFLINTGSATSKDMLDLISLIKSTVKEKFDIDLVEEVQIIKN